MVLLCAPLLVMLLRPSADAVSSEKRLLASLPAMGPNLAEFATYPTRFEKFFSDHFGLRNRMVLANNYIMSNLLYTSPAPKVIIGQDGWLYYAPTPTLEAYRGMAPFSAEGLQQWQAALEQREDWFEARGMKYLFVVVPSKESIYPQHLPSSFDGLVAQTPLDQLLEYLNENSDATLLDIRSDLTTASSKQQTYLRTDSHWNHIGAYIGYRRIVEETQRWFPQETWSALASFPVLSSKQTAGDLAGMLGLQGSTTENYVSIGANCGTLETVGISEIEGYKMNYQYGLGVLRSQCDTKTLRAVVFRDSFFSAALPYFNDQFGQVIYVWNFYDHTLMKKILTTFKPDLVIEERTERDIWAAPRRFAED